MLDTIPLIELALITAGTGGTAIAFVVRYILNKGRKLDIVDARVTALEVHDAKTEKAMKEEIEKAYIIHVKHFESIHAIEVDIASIKAILGERFPPK